MFPLPSLPRFSLPGRRRGVAGTARIAGDRRARAAARGGIPAQALLRPRVGVATRSLRVGRSGWCGAWLARLETAPALPHVRRGPRGMRCRHLLSHRLGGEQPLRVRAAGHRDRGPRARVPLARRHCVGGRRGGPGGNRDSRPPHGAGTAWAGPGEREPPDPLPRRGGTNPGHGVLAPALALHHVPAGCGHHLARLCGGARCTPARYAGSRGPGWHRRTRDRPAGTLVGNTPCIILRRMDTGHCRGAPPRHRRALARAGRRRLRSRCLSGSWNCASRGTRPGRIEPPATAGSRASGSTS